jgi:hypothetical protein
MASFVGIDVATTLIHLKAVKNSLQFYLRNQGDPPTGQRDSFRAQRLDGIEGRRPARWDERRQ